MSVEVVEVLSETMESRSAVPNAKAQAVFPNSSVRTVKESEFNVKYSKKR